MKLTKPERIGALQLIPGVLRTHSMTAGTRPDRLQIAPPIILVGDGQVELFTDPEAVAKGVEAVDAALYRAYDSRGYVLQLTGDYPSGRFLGVSWVGDGAVSVRLDPARLESRRDELRVALSDWWRGTGGGDEARDWDLDQLLTAIAVRDGVK